MRIHEFNFFLRAVTPPLFLLLPIYSFISGSGWSLTLYLFLIAVPTSVVFCYFLGQGISFAPSGKEFSVERFFLGVRVWENTFKTEDFDAVSTYGERVYTSRIPIPAYRGAYVCCLIGKKINITVKTNRSESLIKEVAAEVSRITGLPKKNSGEIWV